MAKWRAQAVSFFPGFSAELKSLTGIDNGYTRCGGLEFAAADRATLPEEWRGAGIEVAPLTEAATREMEPALASGLGSAALLPELAQVRNPRHIKALIAACADLKVVMRPHCPAQDFMTQGTRIEGIRSAKETFQGDKYLLTAGAWSDSVLAGIGWHLDIKRFNC